MSARNMTPAEIDRVARAVALFPNQGLHDAARTIALCHERGVQYLEQAPVLVLGFGARFGKVARTAYAGRPKAKERAHHGLELHRALTPLFRDGALLKDVLRACEIAPPLRRLSAAALAPSYMETMAGLSRIDPAVLGRIVPEKVSAQRAWLGGCGVWRMTMARRGMDGDAGFAWAAERLSGLFASGVTEVVPRVQEIADVADLSLYLTTESLRLVSTGRRPVDAFHDAWGWKRAVEEHDRILNRVQVEREARALGLDLDASLDRCGHPDRASVEGLEFVALRTARELGAEGHAMRHCVATYVGDVVLGRSHILSARRDGRRVATVEVSYVDTGAIVMMPRVTQVKGPANADPGDAVTEAALAYLRRHRDAFLARQRADLTGVVHDALGRPA